jgi:restriction system protein
VSLAQWVVFVAGVVGMAFSGPGPRPMTAAQVERAHRQAYQVRRQAMADKRTAEITDWAATLESVLAWGVSRDARIDLSRRRRRPQVRPLDLGAIASPIPPPEWDAYAPKLPGWLSKKFGRERRFEERLAAAQAVFEEAQRTHAQNESDRQARVTELRRHVIQAQREREAVATTNASVDHWIEGVESRRREDVERYLAEVLAAVPTPAGFPNRREVTYDPIHEHAVVRFELPHTNVIPPVRGVIYVKTKDEFREVTRPTKDSHQLYRSLISQLSLLVIRDLFDADVQLKQISYGGHLAATHPATGQADYPCLVSVIVRREEFVPIVLTQVQSEACLRHLKALVSAHPFAVEAVRPLVDFDRTRFAFTQSVDVVSGLDYRDDLMALTPTEFEHLVRQLFEALPGMEGWTTQASRDDGIDGVIFNATPITGGLTVVQVKQYSSNVGVDAVRELMGAMEHKKAGRGYCGIRPLVTTIQSRTANTRPAPVLHALRRTPRRRNPSSRTLSVGRSGRSTTMRNQRQTINRALHQP